jgi:hypothetical protein
MREKFEATGAIGVGILTKDSGTIHGVMSLIAFLFSGLSAISSVICSYAHKFKFPETPFSVIPVILGVISLGALALFMADLKLGLCVGVGGMERMSVYPLLMCGAGFGGHLIAHPEKRTTEQKQQ